MKSRKLHVRKRKWLGQERVIDMVEQVSSSDKFNFQFSFDGHTAIVSLSMNHYHLVEVLTCHKLCFQCFPPTFWHFATSSILLFYPRTMLR